MDMGISSGASTTKNRSSKGKKQKTKSLKGGTPDASRASMLNAVKQNGLALYYASADLKADRGVVLEAVKQNGQAIMYAS